MEKIITKDGTPSFHNEKYDEFYHSSAGARGEAIAKYVEACGIDKLNKPGEKEVKTIKILDVCFGIGYNSAAAIEIFKGEEIECVGLENDGEIMKRVGDIDYPFACAELMKNLNSKLTKDAKEIILKNNVGEKKVNIRVLIGDARDTIKELQQEIHNNKEKFDFCFFDPFSPKKCPELWTEEFFKDVHSVLKTGAILSTYSCAGQVRRNMRATGFEVKDGPIYGRRAPSTIGIVK